MLQPPTPVNPHAFLRALYTCGPGSDATNRHIYDFFMADRGSCLISDSQRQNKEKKKSEAIHNPSIIYIVIVYNATVNCKI